MSRTLKIFLVLAATVSCILTGAVFVTVLQANNSPVEQSTQREACPSIDDMIAGDQTLICTADGRKSECYLYDVPVGETLNFRGSGDSFEIVGKEPMFKVAVDGAPAHYDPVTGTITIP